MTPLEAALKYASGTKEKRFYVLPVWWLLLDGKECACPPTSAARDPKTGKCKTPGKHAMLNGWQKKATCEPAEIKKLWARYPNAHVGIMPSPGHSIIDVDPRNGGKKTLERLMGAHPANVIPKTVIQKSGGGGVHLFFKGEPTSKIGDGIDIKRNGRGYVVAYPAQHTSGRKYEWKKGRAPWQAEMQPLPDWLSGDKQSERRDNADGEIPEGERNSQLASLAGSMRRRGMSAAAIKAALLAENKERCNPPLGNSEVRVIANSVARYAPEFSTVEDAALNAPCLADFLDFEFKKRELLLDPVITTQSLNMLYGLRGMGKTRFAVTMAFATASGGSVFGWTAPRPVKTLYLDGEMAGADLQGMLRTLRHVAPPVWAGDTLRVFTPDAQNGGIPDLATVEGQQRIEQIFEDAELIFIDNLSAWVRGAGEENSAESWAPMLEWLMRLRQQGRSVVLLHHAGKSGAQRGTSKREDVLDVVLALRRPANYSAQEGARFEVHFEKARGLHGDAVAPFEAWLKVNADGVPAWDVHTSKATHTQRILELHHEGHTQASIAKQLQIARSTVSRAIDRHGMPPVDEK
jgi:hypothetical protein